VLRRGAVAYVVLVAVLVGLGLVVTWSDRSVGWSTGPDRAVESALAEAGSGGVRSAVGSLTGFTDPFTVLAVAAAAVPLLVCVRRWRQATVLLAGVLLELAVFLTVSLVVDRARPAIAPEGAPFTGSFPSGHSAMAVALWGGLAVVIASLARPRWVHRLVVVLAVLAALGAGAARIVLGYHHLSDVLAGWALGGVCLVWAVRNAARLEVDEPPLEVPASAAVTGPMGPVATPR